MILFLAGMSFVNYDYFFHFEEEDDIHFTIGRILFALSITIFFYHNFKFFILDKYLGPKVIIVSKMVQLIYLISVNEYEIINIYKCILEPNSEM